MNASSRYPARALALALSLLFAACGDEQTAAGTGLYVTVNFSGSSITQLRFTARTAGGEALLDPVTRPELAGAPLSSPQTARVRAPDRLDGQEAVVTVEGLTGGGAVAAIGEGRVTITRGREQDVSVTLAPSAVARLFISAPSGTISASGCAQLLVESQDQLGNRVPPSADLTVTLSSDSPTLSFFASPDCAGIATSNVVIPAGASSAPFSFRDPRAGNPNLTGTAASLPPANRMVTIQAGPPVRLAFTAQPPDGVAGVALSPAIQVAVQDAYGNTAASAAPQISLALDQNPPGGTLSGTTTLAAAQGVATFPMVSLNRAGGGYTLKATSLSLGDATSSPFAIAPAAADRLLFSVPPADGTAGSSLAPAVQVMVADPFGNLVSAASATVTVALEQNPGGSTLSGATTAGTTAGVAAFSTLSLNKAASGYALRATATGLTSAVSPAFAIAPASAAKLAFTVQPGSATAGQSIVPAPQVMVQDAYDNPITGWSAAVTMAISVNPGQGTLSGTTSLSASGGPAVFTGLSINRSGSGYRLVAASGTLAVATSDPFDITPGPAVRLAFATQPSNVLVNQSISPAVRVAVEDSLGNTVASPARDVSVAVENNPSSGALNGTLTVTTVNGIASFSNLSLNAAGAGYTLRATAGPLSAVSGAFDVAPPGTNILVFAVQPTDAQAGAAIPQIRVEVRDGGGALQNVAVPITLSISPSDNPGNGTLSGTTTVTSAGGVALFGDLSINKAGVGYRLVADSPSLVSRFSAYFNISPAAPAALFYTVQPGNTVAGAPITPAVKVEIRDAQGNLVTSSTAPVTLALSTNPPGDGTLSGTATVSANGGVATFSDLSVNRAATGYVLGASSGTLTSAQSGAFDILVGPAAKVAFTRQPAGATAGTVMAPVEVTIQDSQGNRIATSSATVSLSLASNPWGGALSGTTMRAATAGVATFADLSVSAAGAGYQLNAAAAGLTGAQSAFFDIAARPPAVLTLTPAPYSYGAIAFGATRTQVFTLTNTGSQAATSIMETQTPVLPFQVTQKNCGNQLGPAASCTVTVAYSPSSSLEETATLQFSYHDGSQTRTVESTLTGRGADPAQLVISEGLLYDYGQVVRGTSRSHTFTITNSGGVPATSMAGGTFTNTDFRYAGGGGYPGSGGTCGLSLNGNGAQCTVVVELAPASGGSTSDSLQLQYDNGVFPASESCSVLGEGVEPALLAISDGPGPFSFGTWGTGRTVDHQFVVENTGGAPATAIMPSSLIAPFSYKGGTYPGIGGTCGTTLAAGARCGVVITFAPTAASPSSANLSLGYQDGAGPGSAVRAFTGAGTTGAWLAFTDFPLPYYSLYGVPSDGPEHDFGYQGASTSAVRPFYLTNTGSQPASVGTSTVTAPFAFHGGPFPGHGGTCTSVIEPGQQCAVVLEFSPTDESPSTGTAAVSYQSGPTTFLTATRNLAGAGTLVAALRIEDFDGLQLPGAWDFGRRGVGVSSEWTFWVRNTGAQKATRLSGAPTGADFTYKGGTFPGAGGTCQTDLEPGGACLVTVAFTPGFAGEHTGAVGVQYFDGVAPVVERAVRGTGVTGALLAFDNRNGGGGGLFFDYGPRAQGSSWPMPFTLLNVGTEAATGLGGAALPAPFAYHGTPSSFPGQGGSCGTSLGVGQRCRVAVSFTPTVPVASAATVRATYSDTSGGPRSAERAVIGRGVSGAVLAISDHEGDEGGQYEPFSFGTAGVVSDHTFYVRNIGTADATSVGAGSLPAPFAVVGSTCPALLPPAGRCAVTVRFTPIAAEDRHGATLQVSYLAGGSNARALRDVVAASTGMALLLTANYPGPTEDQGEPLDFGTSGQPVDRILYVVNRGALQATSIAAGLASQDGAMAFKGGMYPGQGGSCGAQLAPGASCTLAFTFSPSFGNGIRSAVLNLGYSGGPGPARQALTGVATSGPYLAISDDTGGSGPDVPHDFGTSGIDVDRTFRVTNAGASPAMGLAGGPLANGFGFKGGSFPGTGGTCDGGMGGLGAGQQCTVVVTFSPSGDGARASTLVVSHQGLGTGQASRELVGTATTRALLRIRDESGQTWDPGAPFDYGVNGLPVDHTFHVHGLGGQNATGVGSAGGIGLGFSFKGGGGYPGSGGTCGASVAPGTSCTVVVTFSPSGSGARSGRISLGYQDTGGSRPPAARDVVGTATTTAHLVIQDWAGGGGCTQGCGPYDFGLWGIPVDHAFTVKNTGAVAATNLAQGTPMSGGFGFKGGVFPGSGGTCQTTNPLGAGGTCEVVVTFTPSGTGPRASTLELSYFDGAGPRTAGRALSGAATTDPLLVISDSAITNGGSCSGPGCPPYDYGTWGRGTEHTFYVRNHGGSAAQSVDGAVSGPGFDFKDGIFPGTGGTCTRMIGLLAPPCTVVVTFNVPVQPPGPRSGSLTLSYNDGGLGLFSATRALAGTSTDRAFVTVHDNGTQGCTDRCGPFDYGSTSGILTHVFTVFNAGALTATTLGPASTPFTGPFDWAGLTGYPGSLAGGSCPTLTPSLASGGSCTIEVKFQTTVPGTHSGRVNLRYSDSLGGTMTTGRDLRGTRL